jgi:hypothetical protein
MRSGDVREAMAKLENYISQSAHGQSDTNGTLKQDAVALTVSIQ